MDVKSNTEWKYWGKTDPLWSVASWPGRQKSGKNPWTEEEFYALGQRDWEDFLAQWRKFGVTEDSLVEIGCGAGRMTKAIAGNFRRVVGLDVSEDMVAYASERVPAAEFKVIDGKSIPCPDASLSAAFSTHVFQHLESKWVVEAYFREIFRVLESGGSMMIHVPIFAWPPRTTDWVKRFYAIGVRLSDLKSLKVRKALRRGGAGTLMEMRSYPIQDLFEFLHKVGFSDIQVAVFETKSNGHAHEFVFARKP